MAGDVPLQPAGSETATIVRPESGGSVGSSRPGNDKAYWSGAHAITHGVGPTGAPLLSPPW
jgi:hypothetical protein